jgi:CTP:molybdopterin cytidylyltransferase MocA
MKPQSVTAIVLAAGFSERMGDFKPLMRLGGNTVLERVIRLFQSVGVGRIHVVIGHRAAELTPLIERWGGRSVVNARYADGMYASVAAGVSSLEEDTAAFFVLPADIPLVRPATLRSLMRAFPDDRTAICHPTFQGRRGHPPLISRCFSAAIMDGPGNGGLKTLLERYESVAVDVPVADEFILLDLDGPDDFQHLGERLKTRDILSPAECHALLLERLRVPSAVWNHGRAVAEQALRIGRALTAAGCCLDLGLMHAAALVHDMARGESDHARRGAEILRELDMPLMAEIVETHMDLDVEMGSPIREAEIVYLADKLICEDRFVGIDRRFSPRLQDHRADPQIEVSIRSKLESARRSADRIESVIGRPLTSLRSLDYPSTP